MTNHVHLLVTPDEALLVSFRGLFKRPENGALLADVRRAVNQGLVLVNEHFEEEVTSVLECNTQSRSVGRPRKK